jgi:hypothetical protein
MLSFVIRSETQQQMAETERVSLAIEPELLARFDALIERSGGNRSEAMRLSGLGLLALLGCSASKEATSVDLPLYADASGISAVTTDLGYEVELTEARLALDNFQFAIAGEAHEASLWRRFSENLIATAWAHPGHFEGGDVTGELKGHFIVEWLPRGGSKLGEATMLTGQYKSVNFTYARATSDDGLDEDDALLGHTARLAGSAKKGSVSVEFIAILDSPEGRELSGVPFVDNISETSHDRLGFELLPLDPYEEDTLFDGLDFEALDTDGDGQLVIEETSSEEAIVDAYNQLRRTFQTHDHFLVKATSKK